MAVYELFVNDFLALTQDDTPNMKAAAAINFLVLRQSARTQFLDTAVRQGLNIGHSAIVDVSIRNISAQNYLELHQKGARTFYAEALSNFAMWDRGAPIKYEKIIHTLALTQTVSVTKSKNGTNTFVIGQSATYTALFNRSLTNTLSLVQYSKGHKLDKYFSAIDLPDLTGPNAPEC